MTTSFAGLLPPARTSPAAASERGASIASSPGSSLSSISRTSCFEEMGEGVRIPGVPSPMTMPNAVPFGDSLTNDLASSSAFANAVVPEESRSFIEADASMTRTTSLSIPAPPKKCSSGRNGRANARAAKASVSVRSTRSTMSSSISLRRLSLNESARNIHAPHSMRSAVRFLRRCRMIGAAAATSPRSIQGEKNDIIFRLPPCGDSAQGCQRAPRGKVAMCRLARA